MTFLVNDGVTVREVLVSVVQKVQNKRQSAEGSPLSGGLRCSEDVESLLGDFRFTFSTDNIVHLEDDKVLSNDEAALVSADALPPMTPRPGAATPRASEVGGPKNLYTLFLVPKDPSICDKDDYAYEVLSQSGWLNIKAGKTWKKKYFVCENGALVEFSSDTMKKEGERTVLESCCVVNEVVDAEHPHSFSVSSNTAKFGLDAENVQDKKKWEACLKSHMTQHQQEAIIRNLEQRKQALQNAKRKAEQVNVQQAKNILILENNVSKLLQDKQDLNKAHTTTLGRIHDEHQVAITSANEQRARLEEDLQAQQRQCQQLSSRVEELCRALELEKVSVSGLKTDKEQLVNAQLQLSLDHKAISRVRDDREAALKHTVQQLTQALQGVRQEKEDLLSLLETKAALEAKQQAALRASAAENASLEEKIVAKDGKLEDLKKEVKSLSYAMDNTKEKAEKEVAEAKKLVRVKDRQNEALHKQVDLLNQPLLKKAGKGDLIADLRAKVAELELKVLQLGEQQREAAEGGASNFDYKYKSPCK